MDAIPKPSDPFDAGANGRGSFSISELGAVLEQLFFLPGDWLLWVLYTYATPLAEFLELSPGDYGGVFSGFVSTLAWLALAITVSIAYTAAREFDERLTRRLVDLYRDARRRARIAGTLLAYRLRRARGKSESAIEFSEHLELSAAELELSTAELRLLRACAELQPGYAFSVSDAAAELNARKHEVQQALSRLRQLDLLKSILGGPDGETAYTLTGSGRAFLLFQQIGRPMQSQTQTRVE